MQGPVWNKLVRTRLYTDYDIEFPTANKGEDGALMVQLSFLQISVFMLQSLFIIILSIQLQYVELLPLKLV